MHADICVKGSKYAHAFCSILMQAHIGKTVRKDKITQRIREQGNKNNTEKTFHGKERKMQVPEWF